ncbi:Sodium/glutamate symport protein [Klebsiella pneumoniae]|uniref:Sodium/glutamate symport protein n=1 Tax=Klebsiella pneumoniae TaxID=573 RepID=A0A377XIZ2_KLEPN|nr:Sodium/glutamate symport protein [Klebsiella pneumoniae]
MFHLDTLSTLVAATLVLLLGRKLVQTVPFLKKYTIPDPLPAVCWWRWRCWR